MTRIFKFRAWDKTRNAMFPVATLTPSVHVDIDEAVTVADFEKQETYFLKKGDYELMQFTGLLDKNGKEIYERDILDDCTVTWDERGARFMLVTPAGTSVRLFAAARTRAISGNIHENPDVI